MIKTIDFMGIKIRYMKGFSDGVIFNTKDVITALNIKTPNQDTVHSIDFPALLTLAMEYRPDIYDYLFDKVEGINIEMVTVFPITDEEWSNL